MPRRPHPKPLLLLLAVLAWSSVALAERLPGEGAMQAERAPGERPAGERDVRAEAGDRAEAGQRAVGERDVLRGDASDAFDARRASEHLHEAARPPAARGEGEAAATLAALVDSRSPRLGDPFGFRRPVVASTEQEALQREPPHPFLPGEDRSRSYSIGDVTTGYVVNARAVELPGRTWDMLPRQRARGLIYGTDEVVAMIVEGADAVDRAYPGSTLWLGNIGRHGGGDIPWSVSHNAGRDADIAFYTLDPFGAHVQPPGLLRFDDRGLSRDYDGWYRFDVPRNWELVRSLVTSSHAQVQFLFISNGLRRLLLQHAQSIGESQEVIRLAGRVLRQPGAEIPHDDHLHLRVYCSAEDKAAGCRNRGTLHAGIERHAGARQQAVSHALALLRDEDPETRAAAVQRLVLLGETDAAPRIRGRLSDPSPWVRRVAARALGEIGGSADAHELATRHERETSPEVRAEIRDALGALGGPAALSMLRATLSRPEVERVAGKEWDLRLTSLRAIVELNDAAAIDRIVPLLASSDPAVRDRAHWALTRLANFDPSGGVREAPGIDISALRAELWQRWAAEVSVRSFPVLLREGFHAAGHEMQGGRGAVAAALARAAGEEREHLRVNAQRELMRLTANTPRSLEWAPSDARLYWTRWVRRNPSRISTAFR